MEAKFWRDKWASNQIGFHSDEFHPMLVQHWHSLEMDPSATVFVPLCGKSADMVWLRARGHDVVGVELSEIAAAAFFDENQVIAERFNTGPFRCYRGGGYTILCGDLFELKLDHISHINCVYDRASLIALPPETRQSYAAHLASLCASGTMMLLVTLNYPADEVSPPPFLVGDDEVDTLYSSWCDVTNIGTDAAEIKGVKGRETAFRLCVS
jgi:thiopurine S-methyltransferase